MAAEGRQVDRATAELERCGENGCGRHAPLAIRVEMPGDTQFRTYCKRHFEPAVEFVRMLWLEKGAGITHEATWDCGREGCGKKAVVTFRVRTDEGPKMIAFCREHLCIAFEVAANLHDVGVA